MKEYEKVQHRTKRIERAIGQKTLYIPIRNHEEREYLRSHVWYSAASDDYIASFMKALPLAAIELMRIRRVKTVTLTVKDDDCYLETM